MVEYIMPSSTLLMADDDPEDCLLTQNAWEESGSPHQIRFVRDRAQLLDDLHRRGKYANTHEYPLPSIIFLDLHMPKRSGLEVLQEMRTGGEFRHIPVVVFTHSLHEEDTCRTYALGTNVCLTKPRSTQDYHFLINTLSQSWSNMLHPPSSSTKDVGCHPTRSWM